ncbi:MAG: hypothetical protein Q8N22_02270 [bacterium]|nr:hypothetical protein [bacterium]
MIKINPNIFKANDIRGKYPSEINERVISEIVGKLADFFPEGKIVVAHDARLSSPVLYKAVITGFKNKNLSLRDISRRETKLKTIEVGLATTPMFYFLVKKLKAGGGIMITASHNPKNYNGLKIVDKNALPISGLEVKKLFKF